MGQSLLISEMTSKASRNFILLRKLKTSGLTHDELVAVYKGYIRPVLEYAAPLWHSGLNQTQTDNLE